MDNGRTTIQQKFLDRNDLFGLEFRQGYVFLEVLNWEPLKFEPYNGIDEIAGNDMSGWQRIEDESDDILYVEKGRKRVLHGAIGIYPENIRQYTRYPEGQQMVGHWPNLTTPAPSNGSDYGYVDGGGSPYRQPTDDLELFIPPGVHLDFNFYNASNEATTPKLNMVFRNYVVRPLKPRNNDNDEAAVKKIMRAGSPIPVAPVGTIGTKDDYNLDSWDVEPLNRSEIEAFGNNRGGR